MSARLDTRNLVTNQENEVFWEALLKRDARFDGRFFFGVASTKIYCRPSCSARHPRRDRVSFFASAEAAEEAGFRACKRCRPQQPRLVDPHTTMVQQACRLIEENLDEPLNLEELGRQVGFSSFHLQRTFKNIMGVSPREYAQVCRTNRFKSGVREGKSLTTAMYDAGYGSSSRLYERADAELGMTPATYSRGGANTKIKYITAKSKLGYILVATTPKGLCAVTLGDEVKALELNLRSEFPLAEIRRDDSASAHAVDEIIAYLEGRQKDLSLPLDIRATAFQRQVWQALRSIPYGATQSYGEVAKAIGQPKAVRAVARACATNPVALVIPCHRVIREDKSLGGYRWGIERKEKLLQKERGQSE
jgi:AraC family transcriptional regulator of adaptative response/methylated-DNA-[protein]-cysteine methyltransferase